MGIKHSAFEVMKLIPAIIYKIRSLLWLWIKRATEKIAFLTGKLMSASAHAYKQLLIIWMSNYKKGRSDVKH